jgi:hypothetical protein
LHIPPLLIQPPLLQQDMLLTTIMALEHQSMGLLVPLAPVTRLPGADTRLARFQLLPWLRHRPRLRC